MDFMLSRATRVTAQWASAPVQHAVARFWRDMEMTLSTTGFVPDNRLMICLAPALPPESYTLDVTENQLTLCAADDLGAVYGLLDISRHYLGVAPFWFWNQQQFEPKPFATVPEGRITGPAAAVGLRGWDLSDAPWLSAWADATENGWEMIFESLLRYRGNMVRTDKQADLAAAMGLRPVQNPQTPLGAAPQQAAAENPEERHKIWQDSIRTLKTSPRIWALGIDGMGDDPDGTASTAALQEQWQLLNATVPGAAAYILLQGETVALYQEGKLKIPDSVIPVLTPAPSASSAGGPGPGAQHGLWFSLCRRDKLTGNPMTAYPGGDTAVNGMLQGAWRGGVRSFWMVGTGDLRPSLMELNLTGALWCTPDTDCAAQRTAYLRCTYRAPDGWALTDSALEDLSVLLISALILYLMYEAPASEQNFSTLMYMILNCQVSENEMVENPLMMLFGELERRDPQHPAVCFGLAVRQNAGPDSGTCRSAARRKLCGTAGCLSAALHFRAGKL